MGPTERKALLYQAVGLVLYLLGLVLFLSVAIPLFSGSGGSALSAVDIGLLTVSALSIAVGRLISHRRGVGAEAYAGLGARMSGKPEQSRLEELGYHVPPEARESDEEAARTDPTSVICTNCGATNDTGYRFCRQCSSEL